MSAPEDLRQINFDTRRSTWDSTAAQDYGKKWMLDLFLTVASTTVLNVKHRTIPVAMAAGDGLAIGK